MTKFTPFARLMAAALFLLRVRGDGDAGAG